MANIRITQTKNYSSVRQPGAQFGIGINTFGLKKLIAGIMGDKLAKISLESIQPALEEARADWPRVTGASGDSIDGVVLEVTKTSCRVAMVVGGEKLIQDPRNVRHKDYAPFVEFRRGDLTHAFHANEPEIRRRQHEGVNDLIREILE